MMQCIQETITSLVQGNADSVGCNYSMLANFQMEMRQAVKAALLLYVILFGISIALRGELPKKSDLFIFLAKFAFVIWAAIGTFDATGTECTGTQWCPTNGLEFIYASAVAALESFPQMLIGAACDPAQNVCICNYPPSSYAPGYEYLSIWDSIDCRLSYYLGLVAPTDYGNKSLQSGMGLFASGGIGMAFALIFSFQILIFLLLLCFTVFFLSITIFFANIYILCLISLTILIYIGPIFVPLVLFKQTKENFNSWARLVLGYALQPAVISAFVAVMMVLFDAIIYSDCIFAKTTTVNSEGIVLPFWEIQCIFNNNNCSCTTSCQNSLGYFMATTSSGSSMSIQSWPSASDALFTYPVFNNMAGLGLGFITALFQGTIFGFIFYYFSKQLAGFASDLTGAPSLGKQALSPTWVVDLSKKVAAFIAKVVYVAVTKDTSPIRQDIEKKIREGVTDTMKSGSGMQGRRGGGKGEDQGSGMSARRGSVSSGSASGTGLGRGAGGAAAAGAYRPPQTSGAETASGGGGTPGRSPSAYQAQVEEGIRRQLDESDTERDIPPPSDTGRRGGTPHE
jgi:type IV secretion system protein VirB6